MDDELNAGVIRVRLDREGFAREAAGLKSTLTDTLSDGAERAGRGIETSLIRAVRTGKIGFDDLKRTAVAALDQIAASAIKSGIAALLGGGGSGGGSGGGGSGGGGLGGALARLIGGSPPRATGGPVAPGRGYLVGERGPELFVPTGSGRIEAAGSFGSGGAREVRVSITVNAAKGESGTALMRSSRQVARAVKAALEME